MPSDDPPGVRRVQVPRERVHRWLATFEARHGALQYGPDGTGGEAAVRVSGADGAVAMIIPVLGPLEPGEQPAALQHQLARDRTVGLIMVRKGGHAVGLLRGGELARHVCGRRYVQGRTKAGGWSQQRYARRRAGQARAAYAKAADDAARVLGDTDIEAVACAGDRAAVAAVWSDPRLAALAQRWDGRLHPCAEPRLHVLEQFAGTVLGVTIDLNAAAQGGASRGT